MVVVNAHSPVKKQWYAADVLRRAASRLPRWQRRPGLAVRGLSPPVAADGMPPNRPGQPTFSTCGRRTDRRCGALRGRGCGGARPSGRRSGRGERDVPGRPEPAAYGRVHHRGPSRSGSGLGREPGSAAPLTSPGRRDRRDGRGGARRTPGPHRGAGRRELRRDGRHRSRGHGRGERASGGSWTSVPPGR